MTKLGNDWELSEMSKKVNNHRLHERIGEEIEKIREEISDCDVIKSSECGEYHKIPLYCSDKNRKDTHYCDVDLLIIKNNKIKVILEIEESDITPIRIFGKFLASALSSHYIYNSETYEMDNSIKFIQIVDTSKLNDERSKHKQFENIKISIQNIIPKCSKIKYYELFYGKNLESDKDKQNEIINSIKEVMK